MQKAIVFDFEINNINWEKPYWLEASWFVRLEDVKKASWEVTILQLQQLFPVSITNIIKSDSENNWLVRDSQVDEYIYNNSALFIKTFMIVLVNTNSKVKDILDDEWRYSYKINSIRLESIN